MDTATLPTSRRRGSRPGRLRGSAVAAALAVVALALGTVSATASRPAVITAADPPAPNVVLVMMDDMRADDLPWLPAVQRGIYDRGVAYSRFYAPTALCCPSRASVLRGQYPHNTGILSNAQPAGGYEGSRRIDSQTLATWLDPTYRTGYVGKYFNGYESDGQTYVPPGWDDWQASLHTYWFTGSLTNDNGVAVSDRGRYNSDVFGDQAVDFIGESAPGDEPYFLHVSMVAPHHGGPNHTDGDRGVATPYVPPRWQGTYDGPRSVRAASFDEADVSDKTGPVAELPRLSAEARRALRIQMAQRRESLLASNAAIRRILDAVDASGEGRSTYVIFMSDNGMMMGEHRYAGLVKMVPYESGSHIPFAIRGPGLGPGTTYGGVAGTMDVAPTVLDLAGVDPLLELDGHSLLPDAQPRTTQRRRAVLLMAPDTAVDLENGGAVKYAPRVPVDETVWMYRGIVTSRWKLIRWVDEDAWELYDLRHDPDELTNLSGQRRWEDAEQRLRDRLDRLWHCVGRACDG